MEKYGRTRQATDENIIQHVHLACWITKAIDTHAEYVILLTFPWQQWFCKHATVLCLYTRIHCLSCSLMSWSSQFKTRPTATGTHEIFEIFNSNKAVLRMHIVDWFKLFKLEYEYLQLDLRLGSPSIAQNSETGYNNWLTCGQRSLNDPEIDGGSTAN